MDRSERLADYLAGALDADERQALEAALARDVELREQLDAMRCADDALGQLPAAEPPPGFETRLDAALSGPLAEVLDDGSSAGASPPATDGRDVQHATQPDDELARRRTARAARQSRFVRAVSGAAAALLLVVAGVSVLTSGSGDDAAPTTDEAQITMQDDASGTGDAEDTAAAGEPEAADDLSADQELAEERTAGDLDEPAADEDGAALFSDDAVDDAVTDAPATDEADADMEEESPSDHSQLFALPADGVLYGPTLVVGDRELGAAAARELLRLPTVATVRDLQLGPEAGGDVAAAWERALVEAAPVTVTAPSDASARELLELAEGFDPDPAPDRGRQLARAVPDVHTPDGRQVPEAYLDDLRACLVALVPTDRPALPLYAEFGRDRGSDVIALVLIRPATTTGSYTHPEVVVVDRATCTERHQFDG